LLHNIHHYLQDTAAGRKSDKSHHEDDKEKEKEKETKEGGKT
jgi:hypothetical protein